MASSYELKLDDLLTDLEDKGVDTSKLTIVEKSDYEISVDDFVKKLEDVGVDMKLVNVRKEGD